MTAVAIFLGGFRIIKTACPASRNTTQHEGIVVVLPAEKTVIFRQFARQVHLMANRAELCCFVKRFQKSPFMEGRLGFHQLIIDPLQKPVLTVGERIMQRFFNGVIAVAFRAVDVSDGMTRSASDSRICSGVFHVVEFWIVESTAEKRDGIVAPRAPSG